MNKAELITILVVDDNSQNLLTVDAILTPEGYHVITLQSAKEALKYLLEHDVTVTLIDVLMPEINGFDLARIMRTREKTRQIPIIFTSGFHVDEADMHAGYDLGAIDYMTLPLNPQILKAKVAALAAFYNRERELVEKIHKIRELEKVQYEKNLLLLNQEKEKEKWRIETEHRLKELKREHETAALLQEKAVALEKSNEALKRFSTTVAHDLQEPLRTIMVRISLLEEDLGDSLSSSTQENMHFIKNSSKRMSEFIRDLLRYSQVENDKKLNMDTVRLQDVMKKVLENLAASIEESKANIRSNPLPAVFGNEAQLVQVIQNLIGNSIKFTSKGPPQITIASEDKENEWIVSVKDNGIGIPQTHSQRLFTVFERLQSRDKYPGTGVGLAICKKIIENHKGKIWFSSTEGQGTTFYFSIPKGTKKSAAAANQADLSGMRVLLVDDDPATMALVEKYYSKSGMTVETTLSGELALSKVGQSRYDAIVMDIQMPQLDGFQTMAILKSRGCEIPTLAYTGLDLSSGKKRFLDAGFSDVINKSEGPAQLLPFLKKFHSSNRAAEFV